MLGQSPLDRKLRLQYGSFRNTESQPARCVIF
jgi:hypothetical protein